MDYFSAATIITLEKLDAQTEAVLISMKMCFIDIEYSSSLLAFYSLKPTYQSAHHAL